MIKATIADGHGSGTELLISENGVANVVNHQHPALDETTLGIPSVVDFKDVNGVSDMQVTATLAAPQFFYIAANNDYDTYVKTVMITIADQNAVLNQFGAVTALTNGVNLNWEAQDLGTFPIKSNMKSNWDFVKLSRGNPSFGVTTSAFRASNVSGNSEGYIPVVDMFAIFGTQYGIRLRKGTKDRLVFEIRDTTTGVDEFTADATITQY
tara:strand:- start:330 stop:959 length:630 start_codon:yes stop_codon:yes gene_type:complete